MLIISPKIQQMATEIIPTILAAILAKTGEIVNVRQRALYNDEELRALSDRVERIRNEFYKDEFCRYSTHPLNQKMREAFALMEEYDKCLRAGQLCYSNDYAGRLQSLNEWFDKYLGFAQPPARPDPASSLSSDKPSSISSELNGGKHHGCQSNFHEELPTPKPDEIIEEEEAVGKHSSDIHPKIKERPCDYKAAVYSLIALSNVNKLVSGHSNGKVVFWDISGNRRKDFAISHFSGFFENVRRVGVWALAELEGDNLMPLAKGGIRLATGCFLGRIKIWDINIMEIDNQEDDLSEEDRKNFIRPLKDHTINTHSWVRSMIQLPDKRLVIGGHNGYISIWNVARKERVAKIHNYSGESIFVPHSAVLSLMVLEDRYLVSGDFNGKIRIWDINDKKGESQENKVLFLFRKPGMTLRAHSAVQTMTLLHLGDNERRLACGCFDGRIHFFKLDSLASQPNRTFKKSSSGVCALIQLGDDCLVSGDSRGKVKIWENLKSGKPSQNKDKELDMGSPINIMLKLADQWLAVGCSNGKIRMLSISDILAHHHPLDNHLDMMPEDNQKVPLLPSEEEEDEDEKHPSPRCACYCFSMFFSSYSKKETIVETPVNRDIGSYAQFDPIEIEDELGAPKISEPHISSNFKTKIEEEDVQINSLGSENRNLKEKCEKQPHSSTTIKQTRPIKINDNEGVIADSLKNAQKEELADSRTPERAEIKESKGNGLSMRPLSSSNSSPRFFSQSSTSIQQNRSTNSGSAKTTKGTPQHGSRRCIIS